jgi:hypothetical protein
MNGSTWMRASCLAGPAYAVMYVVGLLLIVGDEIDEKSYSGMVSYYAESGNRTGHLIGFFLVAVSLLFFLLFIGVLRERLGAADKDGSLLTGLVAAGGAAAAALFLAGTAALAATAFASEFIDNFVVDANLVRLEFGFGFVLLIGGVILSCGLVLATSVLAIRTSALPAWLAWVGLLAVVLAIIEAFLLPLFVIPAWALLVGVVLAMGAPEAQPVAVGGPRTA